MQLLDMQNISKFFFGKPALRQVSFTLESSEIHGLLGENGAGKTTLMNILYGIYTRDAGEVIWQGNPVSFSSPKDAISYKIGMVHQHFMLVPNLTVSQNITLGLKEKGYPFVDRQALNASIKEISETYGLEIKPEAYVSSLSVGEQQRVEILKLLYRDAKLLILDEPTATLTPQEIKRFFQVLEKLRAGGRSAIIISHKIPEIMEITDRVTVLRGGENVATARTEDIGETELSHFMIGRPLHNIQRTETPKNDRKGLCLEDLSLSEGGLEKLKNISLDVKAGEIVGVAGVEGNYQKELAEVILGLRQPTKGTVSLGGRDLSGLDVLNRKSAGIGYISDDRHRDGLIMDMDLTDNMLLKINTNQDYIKYGLIRQRKVRETTQKAVDDYAIRTPGLQTPIRYLSGGNQQKLILSREISGQPSCVIAFQPTRGLDIGATEFIHQKLLELRAQGCSILLIASDLEEILALSDRIAVIYKGQLMDILPNEAELDFMEIGLLMAGKKRAEQEGAG